MAHRKKAWSSSAQSRWISRPCGSWMKSTRSQGRRSVLLHDKCSQVNYISSLRVVDDVYAGEDAAGCGADTRIWVRYDGGHGGGPQLSSGEDEAPGIASWRWSSFRPAVLPETKG